jgi:hypothetical protein
MEQSRPATDALTGYLAHPDDSSRSLGFDPHSFLREAAVHVRPPGWLPQNGPGFLGRDTLG